MSSELAIEMDRKLRRRTLVLLFPFTGFAFAGLADFTSGLGFHHS